MLSKLLFLSLFALSMGCEKATDDSSAAAISNANINGKKKNKGWLVSDYLPAASSVSVAVDSRGNVYLANGNSIQKVSASGSIVILAGIPDTAGSDDGMGSEARFDTPYSMAVDSNGNVYVADAGNHTIRKISAEGMVTTLAGSAGLSGCSDGNGSNARFTEPNTVAVDSNDNVYVAQTNCYTLQKISPSGAVTTIAGEAYVDGSDDGVGTEAKFNAIYGIAVDLGGNIYMADRDSHTIRKSTPNGTVTTLAGISGLPGSMDGESAQFYLPNSIAVDANGSVYVADYGNSTIRKIDASGLTTTIVGVVGVSGSDNGIGTDATFSNPTGVAVDVKGSIYVADPQNGKVRIITP